MRKLLLVGVIGIIVAIALSIGVYKLTRFKTIEKIIQGEKHTLKYYMYKKPKEIKPIPLDQTKRDTAKNTLISMLSYFEYSNDQDEIMDHSLKCKRTEELINKIGWDELMRRSRQIEKRIIRTEIIGEAIYKDYNIYIVKEITKKDDDPIGGVTGYFFKKIGNKYYSDDDPGAEDLFLQALDAYEWDIEVVKDLKEEDM